MFKISEAVPYLQVLQKAHDLGWVCNDGDITPLFEEAHLHGHDGLDSLLFDEEGCDGSIAEHCQYQWVVLSDPDWEDNDAPYITAYRVKFESSNGRYRYYYYINE